MSEPQPRWYMTDETKAEFDHFRSEVEAKLGPGRKFSQDGFIQLFLKHKNAILDVIVNAELCKRDEKSQEQSQPVEVPI